MSEWYGSVPKLASLWQRACVRLVFECLSSVAKAMVAAPILPGEGVSFGSQFQRLLKGVLVQLVSR